MEMISNDVLAKWPTELVVDTYVKDDPRFHVRDASGQITTRNPGHTLRHFREAFPDDEGHIFDPITNQNLPFSLRGKSLGNVDTTMVRVVILRHNPNPGPLPKAK
jgi:hypothetical protein